MIIPPEDLMKSLLSRCDIARERGDKLFLEKNVITLVSVLPSGMRQEVLYRSDEYNKEVLTLKYRYWCGIQMGTLTNPITIGGEPSNEDGSNVVSPSLVTTVETDYEKLYGVILQTLGGDGMKPPRIGDRCWSSKLQRDLVKRIRSIRSRN